MKQNYKGWFIFALVAAVVFFMISCFCLLITFVAVTQKDAFGQPPVDAVLSVWDVSSENHSELYFDVNVYNYGSREAKNIEITCNIYVNNSKTQNFTAQIGNLASASTMVYTIRHPIGNIVPGNSTAGCHVGGCSDCEILKNRITKIE